MYPPQSTIPSLCLPSNNPSSSSYSRSLPLNPITSSRCPLSCNNAKHEVLDESQEVGCGSEGSTCSARNDKTDELNGWRLLRKHGLSDFACKRIYFDIRDTQQSHCILIYNLLNRHAKSKTAHRGQRALWIKVCFLSSTFNDQVVEIHYARCIWLHSSNICKAYS